MGRKRNDDWNTTAVPTSTPRTTDCPTQALTAVASHTTTQTPTPSSTPKMTQPTSSSSLVDPALLNKIDKLFALGVGSLIDLPQLVVVGDQSSGKSSVLEGLTKLPFPRDSGLCTRFATQIIFRRSPVKHIKVSVIPAKDASQAHVEAVTAWEKDDVDALDAISFTKIMIEAQEVMGVTGKDKTGTFSKDVLKIELSDPEGKHLSVVDVPGIFKRTTEGVTKKEDIATVRNMVQGYMENSRSVMLTVIPANVDIATQEILQMAEDVDPTGIRTLGILTKPDLVDPGAEGPVLDLLTNKRHTLTHGWHIVRNLGQLHLGSTSVDRDAEEEKFFAKTSPWTSVEKEKAGVRSLDIRLQEILAAHIKREFPKVRKELQTHLESRRKQLGALGESRDSAAEQLRYLLSIAADFEEIVRKALNTEYAGDEAFKKLPSLKIATLVRNRNEDFSNMVTKFGHAYDFSGAKTVKDKKAENPPPFTSLPQPKKPKSVRTVANVPDIEDILPDHAVIVEQPNEDGIIEWLKELYQTSRGFELGTFQPSILANAVHGQSANWHDLALGYGADIICMVQNFINDLIVHVCHEKTVGDNLLNALSDELSEGYRRAIEHVKFLLHVERSGSPTTLASYFSENLLERRDDRSKPQDENTAANGPVVQKLKSTLSVEDQMVQEIYDILASYYDIARKRFVDNVVIQVGGWQLVTGTHSPLKLFGTKFVSGLTPEELEDIVGEEAPKKRLRQKLLKEIGDLEAGKKILR